MPELYCCAGDIASSTFEYTPIYVLLGPVCLGLVLSATNLMRRVERRALLATLGPSQAGDRDAALDAAEKAG